MRDQGIKILYIQTSNKILKLLRERTYYSVYRNPVNYIAKVKWQI